MGERADAGTQAAAAEQRAPAPQQSGEGTPPAPLALTLSAPTICETLPAEAWARGESWQNDDGTWHIERHLIGWFGVSETAVSWSVEGGTAPYKLVIDGEARDAEGGYRGASGTASVNCALRPGETFIHDGMGRGYRTEPEVDSGLKTIRAVVTDGSGATAEASISVYVVLAVGSSGDILQSGQTYRVFGTLLTAPQGVDHLIIGGMAESEGGSTTFGLGISGGGWVSLRVGDLKEEARSTRASGSEGGSAVRGAGETALDARIDELVESVGQLPSVDRESP